MMNKKHGLFSGLFGGKKSSGCCSVETVEEGEGCCSRSGETASESVSSACCPDPTKGIWQIKVLGAGCKNCHEQYKYVREAVKKLGLSVDVEYITDMEKVVTYDVMSMPAVVVNEKVISMGKVLKVNDVEKLLQKFNC